VTHRPVKSIYVHIPFCQTICPFCAFAVLPEPKDHQNYLQLLCSELDQYKQAFQLDLSAVFSVYFGGGTPSRLSLTELSWIVGCFPDHLRTPQVQWTIELNPEDLSPGYALGLRELGFNRVSLGVQSFDDGSLKTLGRSHTTAQSHQALESLLAAGFNDINLDFMFGYPGQTEANFQKDLSQFTALPATHLSAYALGVEKGSKIYRNSLWREFPSKQEQNISAQYMELIKVFQSAGFLQYEVSNFSKPGHQSRQNLSNWAGEAYLGLGMSAHGYIQGSRYANQRRHKEYRTAVSQNSFPWVSNEKLTGQQQQEELWMLGLRQPIGVDLAVFFKNPEKLVTQLTGLEGKGLLKIQGTRLSLTPQGMLLADELSSYLLSREGVDLLW